MKRFRPKLSYANVVASLALFLALTGGTVWAANKINGKQIKKASIPGNRIKKASVTNNQVKKSTLTNDRIKPGTIQRSALAAGTLPGLIIAEVSATNLPGVNTETPPGPTPFGLVGTNSFTASPGKAYQVMAELVGNPVSEPLKECNPGVQIYINSIPTTFLEIFAGEADPGFDSRFPEDNATASLLTESGPQFITAKVFGDPDCAPGSSLSQLRIVVTEVG